MGGDYGTIDHGTIDHAQCAAQRPQRGRVGTTQRTGHQRPGRLGGQLPAGVVDAAQRQQQRRDRTIAGQRQFIACHLDRHARGGEHPPQRRHRPGRAAHQHRHPVPRGAVLQMLPAQQVGNAFDLRALGCVRPGLNAFRTACLGGSRPGFAAGRDQIPMCAQVLGGQTGRGDTAGDLPADGERHRPQPSAAPQGHHLGREPVRAGKPGRERQQPAHLRPAEPVDRLVRIADDDEVATTPGDGPQQPLLRGVGVLVLVDEDSLITATQVSTDVVAFGDRGGPLDQLGIVDHPFEIKRVEVVGVEGRHRGPVIPAGPPSQCGKRVRAQPHLTGPGEHGPYLLGKAPGCETARERGRPSRPADLHRPGKKITKLGVLLGPGQQSRRHTTWVGRSAQP